MRIKTLAVILLIIIILLSVIFFVPLSDNTPGQASSYMNFEVKMYGINKDMEFVELSGFKPLAWFLGDNEIFHVICKLQAKATTSEFTNAELDLSQVTFNTQLKKGTQTWSKFEGYGPASKIIGVNAWEEVHEIQRSLDTFNVEFGDYTVKFQMFGEIKYRGVGQTEWQTDYLSLTVGGDTVITNMDDTPPGSQCGDSVCANEPYPGENCFTCSADCGSCNSKVTQKSFTVESGSGLLKDIWGIQATWMTSGSTWSAWTNGNTAWDHVNVFAWGNNYCAYVWVPNTAQYNGKVLRAYATMEFYSAVLGKTIKKTLPFIDEPWNDLGVEGKVTIVTGGNDEYLGYSGYWHTEMYDSHLLTENTNYKLQVHYYFDPTNNYILTVNPDCTGVSSVTNTKTGEVVTTSPYTFSVAAGASYSIKVVWGKEASGISATKSGTMGSSNKAITVNAPNLWEFRVYNVESTSGPGGTYVVTMYEPTESQTVGKYPAYARFVRGPGEWSIMSNNGHTKKLVFRNTADYSTTRVIQVSIAWM